MTKGTLLEVIRCIAQFLLILALSLLWLWFAMIMGLPK